MGIIIRAVQMRALAKTLTELTLEGNDDCIVLCWCARAA